MCIGVPCQIVKIHDQMATVEIGGTQREVRLDLLIDESEARVGDFVIDPLLNHKGTKDTKGQIYFQNKTDGGSIINRIFLIMPILIKLDYFLKGVNKPVTSL